MTPHRWKGDLRCWKESRAEKPQPGWAGDLPKVTGRQKQDPDAHSPGSSHRTEGFTCRAARSPRASSVCSKITWALEQSGRPSSPRNTANESADFSNPRVKGVLSGAWAGLNLPTNAAGTENEIIPDSSRSHALERRERCPPGKGSRQMKALVCSEVLFLPSGKMLFLKVLILPWSGEGQKASGS